MSCVEKRHMSHRTGSMLHHRFPNGFTELFMDETDREVSTLTDRAFRSLCIGDDAVYNDEFSYGYSPFSCHKPLAEEPAKKTHHKESKKQGQHHSQNGTNDAQPWKQQKNMSKVSSFLKALSATEESCKGMLTKNGGTKDSNGESWDKSALRSIQRELSEFSSDYHDNLTDGHFSHKNHRRHPSGDGPVKKTGKDAALPSGKSSKVKNGKSTIKLRKLNIKNFFLHSELSPFQTWRDFNRFPFGQEDIVTSILPTDNVPKWYDSPLYKELTEAHRKETLFTEEAQPCQKAAVDPPPTAPKPIPPPPPPKVLPKPSAAPAEKRCSSDGGDGTAAPWRRNRSRARSTVPINQPGILSPPQDSSSKSVEEGLFSFKKQARSVEVKAVEEVSSLASTPFSICQLMTPLIPSRQPTETSEILQSVLSPSALDLPLRPDSEAKLTPEPPVKRDSYKSLASSILFNLKDNRKRVKSRYSPPKFITLELPDHGTQSPRLDHAKYTQAGSEGNGSGFSTPAIVKEGQTIYSPDLDPANTPTIGSRKCDTDRPISDDYLILNLLQNKREFAGSLGEENHLSPFIHSKKNKSPMANKQNYPSLNLYKKASPVDNEMKHLQVPLSSNTPANKDNRAEQNKGLSPWNKEPSPTTMPTNTGLSPNIRHVSKEPSPNIAPSTKAISPHRLEKEGLSSNISVSKIHSPDVPDNAKRPVRNTRDKDFGAQHVSSKEKDVSGQPMSEMDVIRAAREAINAAKNKALSAAQSESFKKPLSDTGELREKGIDEHVNDKELSSSNSETSEIERNNVLSPTRNDVTHASEASKSSDVKREPPPVPKRNVTKSDIQLALDKQQTPNDDRIDNSDLGTTELDLPPKDDEPIKKQGKFKHIFSARQNNYIKSQRFVMPEDEQEEDDEDSCLTVNTRMEKDEETMPPIEIKDSEHIINALKELERARLADRIHENAKNKLGVINIDEEAKTKNDLISRELRNIKRGMLSMRGNTFAKREIFTKRDQEQNKHGVFSKMDSNVIVNRALINDNYDKAKMALEEIISERLKNKLSKEHDVNPVSEGNTGDGSYTTRVQQHKKVMKDSMMEAKEKQNDSISTLKEKDMKERLGDLRDHNHMKEILSQTEGETHRSGDRIALLGMDRVDSELYKLLITKSKHRKDKLIDNPSHFTNDPEEANERHFARQMSDENRENVMNEHEGDSRKRDAPPVPPRSKKGAIRRDESKTKETESLKFAPEEEVSNEHSKCENAPIKETRSTSSGKQELDSDISRKETVPNQSEISSNKQIQDVVNTAKTKPITQTDGLGRKCVVPSNPLQTENRLLGLSPKEYRGDKANNRQTDLSPTREASPEKGNPELQEQRKVKRKAPLKPDHLNTLEASNQDDTLTNSIVAEEPDKIDNASKEMYLDEEALGEIPSKIISPLLLVNGINVNQSPPDQASLSSKSSYFSVESAMHRNTESDSNVYHSLENLIGELEEEVDEVIGNVAGNPKRDSERTEVEYYSVSDHESEPEVGKRVVYSPQREKAAPGQDCCEVDKDGTSHSSTNNVNNQTPMSPTNTFSPTLGIPALFRVKDNTALGSKVVKAVQPWSPRQSLVGSDRGVEGLHHVEENPEQPLTNETTTTSGSTTTPVEICQPKETLSQHSSLTPLSPSNLLSENPKKPQFGGFLTVPQEEDRNSGVSPSSEGVESLTTSTADTGDELGWNVGAPEHHEVSKVPSERSGSTCSGNDSQTGLPRPPAVLPKSEKALLKAMKLTNRRIKKEKAQNKSSHKSSHSSSKHSPDKQRSDNSEHKSLQHKSNSSNSRSSEEHSSSSEKKHRERMEEKQHHNESHSDKDSNDRSEQPHHGRRGHSRENHRHNKPDHKTGRQSHDRAESSGHNSETIPSVSTERQGRSSDRHIREQPEPRDYSSDRVISNVPVYKAHVTERPMSDRQYHRSQSIDRYIGDKVERRLSADMLVNDKFDPRGQRIEKGIMDELQQRGRARDRASRDNALKRSHSIDAYGTEISHPSDLSRQSSHTSHTSHTSQLSRQSSIEHTIVTQSFPMTQRKLLQDPDSGRYFFVDMPVQVKTKTFFDPETGNYVQLPVQPPEGALPQASAVEVLNTPLVVYHGFVPVPLSSMAQKSTIQASHMEQEDFEQRHLERSRQMHCKEGHPYLEPIYGQHDLMLGEFLGTEELDCAS